MINKVKENRLKRGLTQDELSSISGVGRNTIIDLEQNIDRGYSTETLKKLAKAFKKEVSEIFF